MPMSVTVVCRGSYFTVARSVAKLTAARSTPATLPIAFSTRLTQEAQVIPVTGKVTSTVVVVWEVGVFVIAWPLRSWKLMSRFSIYPYQVYPLRFNNSRSVKGESGNICDPSAQKRSWLKGNHGC